MSVEEYLRTSFPDGDREYVDGRIVETNMGEVDHSHAQTNAAVYLASHYPSFWRGVEVRVQVKPTRFRCPDVCLVLGPKPEGRIIRQPPFLVIEVLSPDDRAEELQDKIDDYLAFGVKYVWVMNPRTRRAYAHTSAGIQEVREGSLRTEDPIIELPLNSLFT